MALPEREYRPTITLPPHIPATPEEIARRRAVAADADRIRELIGPIGISVSELIRQVRDEAEGNIEDQESNG